MKPRAVLIAACTGLAVTLSACTSTGPDLLTALNMVSALLDTGTLRALDAQVELDGHGPRSVARAWLRAHGLIPQGGAVR